MGGVALIEVAGGDNRHSGASTGGYTRYFGGSRALVSSRREAQTLTLTPITE